MKKYIIIAAAAIAAMACSKVEVNDTTPDVKVTFQAANYVAQTKADGDPVSVLDDFTAFKCRAFLHAEGVDLNNDGTVKTGATNYQEFFGDSGETITYNNSDAWEPSHTYYWPKGTQSFVNFAGWYSTTGITPSLSYTYTSSKWTATMGWSFSNSTVGEDGINILYADMAWRYKSNADAKYKLDGVTEGVPMLFHHALAQINVKAYAYGNTGALTAGSTGTVTDGTATWTITLTNVKITPVYTAGTLSLTNADPTTKKTQEWSTDGWSVSGTAGDLARTGTVAVDQIAKPAVATTTGDVIAATCVLPQTIGNTVKLSFDLNIHTAYSAGQSNDEIIHKDILLNTMGTSAWAMNTKYTYYLKVVPSQSEVLFDPALEADWASVTSEQGI